mgnify:CR=1 FL=1
MKVVDLARVMAPDLELEFVGIRPGEKLHETMVAEDDGRSTIEIPDRFAILPALDEKLMAKWLERGASQMEDGFYYASNRNPERMDARGLLGRFQIDRLADLALVDHRSVPLAGLAGEIDHVAKALPGHEIGDRPWNLRQFNAEPDELFFRRRAHLRQRHLPPPRSASSAS